MNLSFFKKSEDGTDKKMPSIVNDPFSSHNIIRISMNINKRSFEDSFYAWGLVEFKNGDTKGQQDFNEENFDVLFEKMKTFIEVLQHQK
jgi:hypothetical protein